MSIERIAVLLLIGAIVAMVARRLRLPYTVGLLAAGGAIALMHLPITLTLTKSLIFSAFLPPLIFEAAFALPWPALRKDMPVILFLATVGVLIAAAIVAPGMHYLAAWTWSAAVLFGVLIAATDPVSVIATFREAGVGGRLRILVEAESLLNDGTAAVMFAVALAFVSGGTPGTGQIVWQFALMAGGGVLCGTLVAGAVLVLMGAATDHLVEITFTTVAAYGSFILAEHFGLSGVLATLTAGLMVGNLGPSGMLSERGREAVESFWEYVAFVANTLVFLLIGVAMARQPFVRMAVPVAAGVGLVLLGRVISVYLCCGFFARSRLRVSAPHQHVLVWGGLRGAVALALALGLPASMPERAAIITVAFAMAAFSIIVEGLTIGPLLRLLGELPRRGKPGRPRPVREPRKGTIAPQPAAHRKRSHGRK